jgi:hypothetical protein
MRKSSAGGGRRGHYVRGAGVKLAWAGVACENTAVADVDRGGVSHEESRTIRGR